MRLLVSLKKNFKLKILPCEANSILKQKIKKRQKISSVRREISSVRRKGNPYTLLMGV